MNWPTLTLVSKINEFDSAAKKIQLERSMQEGRQQIESELPAVISISKDFGEPRYPSFMGIRKASKAEIPTWSLADLAMEVPVVHVSWPKLSSPPAQESKNEFIEGANAQEIAEKLADLIIAKGVL